jgi:hypothetical protein
MRAGDAYNGGLEEDQNGAVGGLAGLHPFDEKLDPDPDPDPHYREKRDPDPH